MISTRIVTVLACLLPALASAPPARAQLLAAGDGPIVYGHHHFNTTNMDAQKKFYVETLGGTLAKVGANQQEVIEFPNVLLMFRPMQAPTGGTIGTTVNHIGFSVPNLRVVVDKIKANGFQMVTRAQVGAATTVSDDIASVPPATSVAFAMGPESVMIELVEVKAQARPIQLHHMHFANPQNADMAAWYEKTFGATVRPAPAGLPFLSAELPGVFLDFSSSTTPVTGTQGRALDHIGFEVKGLEAFTKKLEAAGIKLERPYTPVPALGIAIAFIKDPWGTYIELTEGLDKVQ